MDEDLKKILEIEEWSKARFRLVYEALQEIYAWTREMEIQTSTEIRARRAAAEARSRQTGGRAERSGEPAPPFTSANGSNEADRISERQS